MEICRLGGVSVWPAVHACLRPRYRCKAAAGDLHGRALQVGADFSLHRSHPNFNNALGNEGIAVLLFYREVWMKLHADPDGVGLFERGCQESLYLKLSPGFYEQVGVVGVAYLYLLWLPYYLLFIVVYSSIMFQCTICYFWFYAPLFCVMWQVNVKVVEPCMDTPTRNTSLDEELVTNVERPTSAVQAKILMKMAVPTADADLVSAQVLRTVRIDYDVEERWFHTLGFPKMAFSYYLVYNCDFSDPSATGDHHVRSSH